MTTRRLTHSEVIPYDLLLLADETVEAIDRYINDCDIYISELYNKIIAVYALQEINAETAEIKNIAVSEKHQGQGVGKSLILDASKRAKESGYGVLTIGTSDASLRQLDLYKKVGFEIFGKKINFFIDNYPEPIFENGIQMRDMIMLRKIL